VGYATLQDLETRLGPAQYVQLTDDEGTGAANTDRAQEALDAAEAEVDGWLARRFQTPVEVAGEPQAAALLQAMTLDLAEYRLHARRPPVPAAVQEKANAARRLLQDIATGRAHLPVSKPPVENPAYGQDSKVIGPQRIFRRDQETPNEPW